MTNYLYIQGNMWHKGCKIEINFEGKKIIGTLHDADDQKHVVALKDSSGKIHWTHESHVRQACYP